MWSADGWLGRWVLTLFVFYMPHPTHTLLAITLSGFFPLWGDSLLVGPAGGCGLINFALYGFICIYAFGMVFACATMRTMQST